MLSSRQASAEIRLGRSFIHQSHVLDDDPSNGRRTSEKDGAGRLPRSSKSRGLVVPKKRAATRRRKCEGYVTMLHSASNRVIENPPITLLGESVVKCAAHSRY